MSRAHNAHFRVGSVDPLYSSGFVLRRCSPLKRTPNPLFQTHRMGHAEERCVQRVGRLLSAPILYVQLVKMRWVPAIIRNTLLETRTPPVTFSSGREKQPEVSKGALAPIEDRKPVSCGWIEHVPQK